jgi:hypothetical protein
LNPISWSVSPLVLERAATRISRREHWSGVTQGRASRRTLFAGDSGVPDQHGWTNIAVAMVRHTSVHAQLKAGSTPPAWPAAQQWSCDAYEPPQVALAVAPTLPGMVDMSAALPSHGPVSTALTWFSVREVLAHEADDIIRGWLPAPILTNRVRMDDLEVVADKCRLRR